MVKPHPETSGVGDKADSHFDRAATLLQSSGIAYRYGVSGPFWYASGATVQIILFATIAIELKRRAPNAHVSLLRQRVSRRILTNPYRPS
jgi:hypothetical protein